MKKGFNRPLPVKLHLPSIANSKTSPSTSKIPSNSSASTIPRESEEEQLLLNISTELKQILLLLKLNRTVIREPQVALGALTK